MNPFTQKRSLLSPSKQKTSLFVGVILALIARFPFTSAEDIENARTNLFHGERTDFWGSFSPWFFTRISGRFWEETYAAMFALMIFVGALLILKTLTGFNRTPKLIFFYYLAAYYISLLFALDFSRDGALLAFFWFALGVFSISQNVKSQKLKKFLLATSIILFSLAFSFRPWMAPALVIFMATLKYLPLGQIFGRKYFRKIAGFCVPLLVLPVGIDLVSNALLKLEKSYPEQQVLIMDLASIGCLSSNPYLSGEALKALSPIVNESPVRKARVCSQFYPSSVGSLLFYPENWGNATSAVRLIGVNEQTSYEKVRSSWVRLLTSHPKDYVQMKILLGSQWLLAGDSNLWRGSPLQIFLASPLSIARELRLFSGLFVLSILIGLTICNRKKSIYLCLLVFYLSSLSLLTIAFTGDNQRYLLPFSIMSFLAVACERITQEPNSKRESNIV